MRDHDHYHYGDYEREEHDGGRVLLFCLGACGAFWALLIITVLMVIS